MLDYTNYAKKHNLQKPTPNVRDAKWQNIFEINSLFDEKEKKHVD